MYPDIERRQHRMAERLRTLPAEAPPPYEWAEFQRRAQYGRTREHSSGALPYVAAAALLLIAVGSVALIGHRHGGRAPLLARVASVHSRGMPESVPVPDARTQATERWLASLPSEPIIVRFGTRVAVTSLEDRIAQVDDLLTAANFEDVPPARLAALQQERGRLVNSLAQVRYAEALAANAP
jgi:hypothetical protein